MFWQLSMLSLDFISTVDQHQQNVWPFKSQLTSRNLLLHSNERLIVVSSKKKTCNFYSPGLTHEIRQL